VEGNEPSTEQADKPRLIVEVAEEAWGSRAAATGAA